jgi:para-aminobenzoate synthetase component 1
MHHLTIPCPADARQRLRAAFPGAGFLSLDGRGWGQDGSVIAVAPLHVIAGQYTPDALASLWRQQITHRGATSEEATQLPFWAGIIGYPEASGASQCWIGHYHCRIGLTGNSAEIQWTSETEAIARQAIAALVEPQSQGNRGKGFELMAPFHQVTPESAYAAAFHRIMEYIRAGDVYQVNFAHRFVAPCQGDPYIAHMAVADAMQAPWTGFLDTGNSAVLSYSPETFLAVHGRDVSTAPIKGTRPRSADPFADRQHRDELAASAKDRAENLMIVDLLRNDIGKVAETGSVRVSKLFSIESHTHVHHLVSVIEARLAEQRDAIDLLAACFPGGSVTGAPKIRAMQIIDELESGFRGAYCGTLLTLDSNGCMRSNLCIRTLQVSGGEISCWGGGGLVADSDADAEYAETLAKVGKLMGLFEEVAGRR